MLLFLTRRTRDPEVALDLLSETFVHAFEDRGSFRGRTMEQAGAWVWAICRRRLAEFWRAGQIERRAMSRAGVVLAPDLSTEEYERIEHLAGLGEMVAMVRDGVDQLPDDQRRAVHMRIVEERPYDEIAMSLGITQQVVRARVSRGLRTLAERLEAAV